MCDVYSTRVHEVLIAAIKNADMQEARAMFDDADYCARKLLDALAGTGRLLSVIGDNNALGPNELRSLGDSIAVTAELVAGFSEVVEAYNWRCRTGEIREGGQHA
ncbi:TPA: hypothetical protein PPE00_002474 [Escherichia coli]|uniref:hypothetical protein n=1 Tax=Escherichia coli TaxID=562 RepID=UPI000DA5C0D6|nr:hypothetical protein [Escherichia coli]EEV1305678.1 hypothetical protein [Escherichia coli]EEW8431924.1 hypothetical protein [Escherichia coli]EFB1545867.1 hypothetical protein [Escherichia coli]EFB9900905.1 hypothetical protein [Escherichia coli]EFD1686519.1 hypothetical protein [Escherichia coli]